MNDKQDNIYNVRQAIPFQDRLVLRRLRKFTTYGIRVIGFTIGDSAASEEIFVTTSEDRK